MAKKDWSEYQAKTYKDDVCKLLIDFLNTYKVKYNSLETNGYFVGQLFENRDAWKENKYINTFTIKQINEYLKRYKIITLDEVEYIRISDNKKMALL